MEQQLWLPILGLCRAGLMTSMSPSRANNKFPRVFKKRKKANLTEDMKTLWIRSKLRKSVAYWGHCKSVSWQQTLKAVLPNWLEQRFLGLGELFLLYKHDFWAVSVGLFGLIFFLVGSCVAQPAAGQILKKCGYYAGTFVPKMWGNVGLKHKQGPTRH